MKWMEHFAYNCHVASMNIAKELGPAKGFEYHDKLLPINRYNRNADELVSPVWHCDWTGLAYEIEQHGMYNVGLMMVPPFRNICGPI